MIFSVAAIIASFSRGMTLEPGDIIATGTPDGVGFARTPPEFLRDGDEMSIEISGIGTLRNRVAVSAPVAAS
jgi:2-keto-4-pentenoate hydratase/2-oxohepta-3-ene-1,7-dioic acid hydratase in catechol pathway